MATSTCIAGAITIALGAVLYSSLIGVDYLTAFWQNPFNYMLVGIGIPSIIFGLCYDFVNKFKKRKNKNGK